MNLARLRRLFGSLAGLDERRCVFCREPFRPDKDGAAERKQADGPTADGAWADGKSVHGTRMNSAGVNGALTSTPALSAAASGVSGAGAPSAGTPPADGLTTRGSAASLMLCPACRPRLRRREAGFCPHCGEPTALADAPVTPCGSCLQTLPPWNAFLFYGVYEGDLRAALLKGKFSGSLAALDLAGGLLAEVCAEHYACAPKPQLIVPIPLHRSRLRERGFNQSGELARHAGRALDLPVRHDLLIRVRATVPQMTLDREQRRRLVQPFAASGDVRGRHILLLDDVCTTGATLSCAARCLLEAGAARVDVAVAARTSLHSALPPDKAEDERHER